MNDGYRVFVSTDHDTFWPVGAASVIIARSTKQATELLAAALKERGLDPTKTGTVREIESCFDHAVILRDGNY